MKIKNLTLAALLICPLFAFSCQKDDSELLSENEIKEGWTFRKVNDDKWLPASVPGTVHTDLLANNIIEDPYYRLNEYDVQWIDKEDWEYKTMFKLDKEYLKHSNIEIDFKGLDTYAEVFVNGQKILETDNMFREWKAGVKEILHEGENELIVLFRSPIKEGIKKYDAQDFEIPASSNDRAREGKVEGNKRVSIFSRKAPYHYGWDWGPRFVTSGIWRPVYLKAWDDAIISDLRIVQNEVRDDKALFTAVFEVEANNSEKADISLWNSEMKLAESKVNLVDGISQYSVEFEIANPKLWWSNGLGEAHLYDIRGDIQTSHGKASKSLKIGIRTIELVREKDKSGTSFFFKLNGNPVYIKGANYIPNDLFLPRFTEAQYRSLIESVKNSNINMIRVWGGGTYENDIFYDLCDENGILVWQDFMFACSMYPSNEEFLNNIKIEASENVKRLRNHPSIALWCGNNEILAAWTRWGWRQKEEKLNKENADKIYASYEKIFQELLPSVVEEFDPGRKYWSSSPSSGPGIPADLFNGDEHYWGVWSKKEPIANYATHIGRFMSEYGFQSFPEMSTIKKFTIPEDYDVFSDVMKSHQKYPRGNTPYEIYLDRDYGQPKDFESFLFATQVLQADAIRFAIEAHRRAMPYCMGTIYWQLNDVWPGSSWSSIDYYQNWKALQYHVKKAFSSVLVSPYIENDTIKVYIISDKLEKHKAQLLAELMDFNGSVVWSKSLPVEVAPNTCLPYFSISRKDLLNSNDEQKHLLSVKLTGDEEILSENILYFRPFLELELSPAKITHSVEISESGVIVKLSTDKLAKNVYLQLENEAVHFSDNSFDLIPGRDVSVSLKTDLSPEDIRKILKVTSLKEAIPGSTKKSVKR